MPTYDDLQLAMTLMALLLIVVGVALRLLPVGECSECHHCRKRRTPAKSDGFCKLHARPESQCRHMHD